MTTVSSSRIAAGAILWTWSIAFAVTFGLAWIFRDGVLEFHRDIRGYLFSGYLTLGSFLLTTKTFVVTRLQEGLFQSKKYHDRHELAKEQNEGKNIGPKNEPLRRLTEFLVWSVATCLSTAVLQLLLSALKNTAASMIALSSAAAALALVMRSWFIIRGFIHDYLVIANEIPPK